MDVINELLTTRFAPSKRFAKFMWDQSRAIIGPQDRPKTPHSAIMLGRMLDILDKDEVVAFMRAACDSRVDAIYTIWPKIRLELADMIEANDDHIELMMWEMMLMNNVFACHANNGDSYMPDKLPHLNGLYSEDELKEIWDYGAKTAWNYLKLVPHTPKILNLSNEDEKDVQYWRLLTYDCICTYKT